MIKFRPKTEADEIASPVAKPESLPAKTGDAKPAGGAKPDSDGKMRRMRQTRDDNRLL
ncbi:hypothetical protein [Pararhizobium sp.]|uniref:hypothetical protein n=1 Tax=Pararhizobium sp. TaxID=1977563 RepID=UPI002726C910|nr:hypothetical protein [Pararhizobium sp.]MDO9417206.1 hypothetical protein [Pararhizobium sp.]